MSSTQNDVRRVRPSNVQPAHCIDTDFARQTAERVKAIADPARLRIVAFLFWSGANGECVKDITAYLQMSQPVVSHHLRILGEAGLLQHEKIGVWTYYTLKEWVLADIGVDLCTIAGLRRAAQRR